jgi:hypothetical protein
MGIVSRMSDLMFTRDGVVAAVAEGGIRGEGPGIWSDRQHGGALDRLMRKLGGEGVRLRFCYEDGVIPARPFRSGCTRWIPSGGRAHQARRRRALFSFAVAPCQGNGSKPWTGRK